MAKGLHLDLKRHEPQPENEKDRKESRHQRDPYHPTPPASDRQGRHQEDHRTGQSENTSSGEGKEKS